MATEHGGAMADGGEAWKKRYLGSNDGTTTSTRCRRARRSCWFLIAGRGGAPAVNHSGGCVGAARAELEALGSGGEGRQRGRE